MISEKRGFSLDNNESAFLQVRLALGLSRREFGAVLGVDQDTVSTWERGKRAPLLNIWQIKVMDKMLTDLGLSWQDIPDHVGTPGTTPPEPKRNRQRKI